MALFRGIQEYIALNANNITLIFDSGNIVSISGNIILYPPQGHPILYNYSHLDLTLHQLNTHTLETWFHTWNRKNNIKFVMLFSIKGEFTNT